MICDNCGKQVSDDASFCTFCGQSLLVKSEAEQQKIQQKTNEQTQIKSKKKLSKLSVILWVIVIVVFAVLVLVIKNYAETTEMRKALTRNDGAAVYYTYDVAIGDEKLIGKYQELISAKIAEITADIDGYDYSEDAKTEGANVVYERLIALYGGLFEGDYTLEDCVYGANESEYAALIKLIESKEDYCEGIYYSSNAMDVSDYEEAIECFSEVQVDDSNYEDALERITECSNAYLELTLENAEKYIAEDDISSAIDLLNSAKNYFDAVGFDSTEIQSKVDSTLITYAQKYADKAEQSFVEKDVKAAIGNIEVAIELQPDNADYKAKKDEYALYLPYELYDEKNVLEFEENGDFWGTLGFDNTYTANDGSEMPHSIKWYNNSDDATVSVSAIYNLQGKYDFVTGTIFLFETDKSTDYEGYFVVYGDGKKIYTSPKVTGGVIPQEVHFEVSDVQTLEIAFFGQGTGGFLGSGPDFGVSNLVAQKDFA